MRFLEKLLLPIAPEYRVALDEEDLAVLATLLLAHLEAHPEADEKVGILGLELSQILQHVKSEDHRQYHKLSQKLKKKCHKAPR